MSRSVSTHINAVATVYLHPEFEDDVDREYEWECFIEDLQNVITGVSGVKGSSYPSMSPCNRWSGREDHVILENGRAEVSVSEYCGLVSVCLAPRNVDDPLDEGWCGGVASNFKKLLHTAYPNSAMVSMGHFSNGEQVFAPTNRPEGVVTSKEGVLW